MSQVDKLFGNLDSFQDIEGRNFRFVKYYSAPKLIHCWQIKHDSSDRGQATCIGLPVVDVPIEVLKELDIWDKLSVEVQTKMIQRVESAQAVVHGRLEKARKARKSRSEYAHIPREISCSECGKLDKIAPGTFVKKAGLLCSDTELERKKIQDYISSYKCSECAPRRRGRVRNPLYKDIPRKVNCSDCGKECVINAKNVYENTDGDVKKIQKYCNGYLCRSCNPEWGSWLKGKKKKKAS